MTSPIGIPTVAPPDRAPMPMLSFIPPCHRLCDQSRFWAYIQLLESKAERIRKIKRFAELEMIAKS